MSEPAEAYSDVISEVSLPETEEDELSLYRRYRSLGGRAIEEYERRIEGAKASPAPTAEERARKAGPSSGGGRRRRPRR